jgi:hypothetical protein
MEAEFIEYYFALKYLWSLHLKSEFGESPDIPSGYSEALCHRLFDLRVSPTRNNDAIDKNGLEVEIKATGTREGKTTISNSSEFQYLIWLFFDFKNNCIKTYKIPRDCFNFKAEKGRKSLRLSTIVKKNKISENVVYFNISTV